jgi:hypothetical protein
LFTKYEAIYQDYKAKEKGCQRQDKHIQCMYLTMPIMQLL